MSELPIKLNLHIADTPGAGKRHSEAVEALIDLMEELGAPGMYQGGVRMCCDGCGITTAVYVDFDTARATSRTAGWVTVKADDFCPACQKMRHNKGDDEGGAS